jgi:hypothetical protein
MRAASSPMFDALRYWDWFDIILYASGLAVFLLLTIAKIKGRWG